MAEVVVVGSYVQDLAFEVGEFPTAGESRIAQFRTGPGGKGFNQAIAASRQGVETLFIGAVGDDLFAQALREFVVMEQVKLRLETVPNCHSGAAAVTVNSEGQNTIAVSLGANNKLSWEFVLKNSDEISAAKIVVVQLESNLQSSAVALDCARKRGVRTILNPAPINDSLESSLLKLADVVTPNETEFAFLLNHLCGIVISGAEVSRLSDMELFSLCQRLAVNVVVVTLGSEGVFVADCERSAFFRVSGLKVDVVDTTGAGDAFTGGFAAGLVKFGDLREAVVFANKVAALSVTKPGTAPAMPYEGDLQQFN